MYTGGESERIVGRLVAPDRDRFVIASKYANSVPVSAMQLEYSLVQRSIEREHLPLTKAHDIGVTVWSPLAGGIPTGKYTRKSGDTGSKRMDSMQLQPLDARNREIAEALDKIADGFGVTSGQPALAWMMARGVVPIVGATRADQLKKNPAATQIALSDKILAALDAASAFDAGHPYSMLEWEMPMALGYGGMFDQSTSRSFRAADRRHLAASGQSLALRNDEIQRRPQ